MYLHSKLTSLRRALGKGILPALLLCIPYSVQAQQVQQVTFNDAVRLALEQNVTLKRAANAVRAQSFAVSDARMDFYPDVSLSTNGSQNYGRNFSMEEGKIVNTTSEYVGFSAGSSVNVFNGNRSISTLRQARHNYAATEKDHERTQQTVVFNVMSNFLTLIERREQIRVQEENLASQTRQLEKIQALTDPKVGARPLSDLYQQQAEVANAELQLLQAQQAFQAAEGSLIQVLQLDPFGQYDFVAPAVDSLALQTRALDLRDMLQQAYGNRADLKASESDILSARESIRIARSTMYPSVSLRTSYGSNYSSQDLMYPNFLDQLNNRRGGSFGFSVAFPLFDRWSTRNNVQRARVRFDDAQLALQGLQQNIAVEVRQAYLDYQTTIKELDVTAKQERSAALALEAAQERYNVQAATLVEVTQARANYVRAQSARVSARYDLMFQQKLIDYYLGILDPNTAMFR